ncbi:hypothetical protein KQX54_006613 [Cotesia glomerata]|uniref:DWNN domain-containing protein n=1 Tax=Cotesia glomerata TaxID=32391 RepID=A0AAV7I7J6_COTGL|nr:hypothetical protein KQX54_006613 [Cotesia glomerata]
MSVICELKSFKKIYYVDFDGLSISIENIKADIIRQMRVKEDRVWDIIALNPSTRKEYENEDTVIHNTRILLQRRIISETEIQERKRLLEWKRREAELQAQLEQLKSAASTRKYVDLTKMEGTEEEKIKKMMELSTRDYAPSNWLKVPYKQSGPVPAYYICRRCQKPGHWVYQCKFMVNGKPASIKKAKGIPQTMMTEVEGPEVPGAMLTSTGKYVVYSGIKKQPSSSPPSSTSSPSVPSPLTPSPSPPPLTAPPSVPSPLTPSPSPPTPSPVSSLRPPTSKSPIPLSSGPLPSLSPKPTTPLSASIPTPSSSLSQGATGFPLSSYTPSIVENTEYYSSSNSQGSGYQYGDYEHPIPHQYLGEEPYHQEVYGYSGYHASNHRQHTEFNNKRRQSGQNSTQTSRSLIVKLKSPEICEHIIEVKRRSPKLLAKNVFNTSSDSNQNKFIYINEFLHPDIYKFVQKIKTKAKLSKIKYVWTDRGNVYAKKDDDSPKFHINTEDDLEKLL